MKTDSEILKTYFFPGRERQNMKHETDRRGICLSGSENAAHGFHLPESMSFTFRVVSMTHQEKKFFYNLEHLFLNFSFEFL
jgi:hypothetical protein